MRTQNADTAINVTCDAPASESLPNARIVATSIITSNAIGVNDSNADGRFFKCAVAAWLAVTCPLFLPSLLFSIVFILKHYVYLYIIIYYYDMQSYCIFCIHTTFYTIKAYIITIKNKLTNKIMYRYTPFVAEVKASAASNDIYQKFLEDMTDFFTYLCFISARVY